MKEVAGTKVYEQRRHESVKIMNETALKREKINELLDFIENRLKELDEEKDELKQYQEADRERRCIEYAIYIREQNEATEALEDLNEQKKEELALVQERFQALANQEEIINNINCEIKDLKQTGQLIEFEKYQLNNDVQELITSQAQIKLLVDDMSQNG